MDDDGSWRPRLHVLFRHGFGDGKGVLPRSRCHLEHVYPLTGPLYPPAIQNGHDDLENGVLVPFCRGSNQLSAFRLSAAEAV